ncbi:uncharacterized protein LOC144950510 [Lampetra fluviatilis]
MEGGGEVGTGDAPRVQDVVGAAGPSASTGAEEGWRHVMAQLDSLRAVLMQLCTLVTTATRPDRPSGEPSSGAETSAIGACATLPALSDKRQDAAILGVVGDEPREAAILLRPLREAAILTPPHGDAILSPPRGTPAAGDGDSGTRSHHLTTVKEFSIGGDWSAFACRFEAAVRSAKWTDAEALEVLPTLLDDESVRFFRSIKATRKTTLKGVFEEMAEAYEPPDDAHRRFVQRQRAPEESPVAFRGAVLELAMATYPDTEPDLLEPLIFGKMLELSRNLGIPMPVCGHEQLTSQIAAKCLDAQFNLRRWKQVTAWTGSPNIEGGATGWHPSKAVYVQDEKGPEALAAASTQWPPRGGAELRSGPLLRDRQDKGGAGRRADLCFRCGRRGHFARECWARSRPPLQ